MSLVAHWTPPPDHTACCAGAIVVAIKAALGRWLGRGVRPTSRAMYQGWCGSRAEDGCCSALGTVGWSRPIATLGGRNRCPGPEIVAITCAAFPKHTHSHLSWPVGPEGLDRQADCPLISTRTRGEMPRRPDVLACARERKAAGRGGSVERTQGAGARSASATPLWAEGVGFGSSARCGSSCPPVVPSRQTTRSAHRAQDIRHQQSCSTGKQSHGGRRSATWCLGSHSAEAAYRSRALGRIVWRASATRRTAPASTLSG